MEAVIGLRVTENICCAAADLQVLIYLGSDRGLADGFPELGATTADWFVMADGKDIHVLNLSYLRSPAFRVQKDFSTAASETLCAAPKQICFTLKRLISPSFRYGRTDRAYEKKGYLLNYMDLSGILGTRSIIRDRFLAGKDADQDEDGSRILETRRKETVMTLATQIWFWTASLQKYMHRNADQAWDETMILDPLRATVSRHRSGHKLPDLDLCKADLTPYRSDLEIYPPEKKIQGKKSPLFIRSMGGHTICIEIGLWEATENLKQRIHEKTGIPPYKQLLLYAGKVMQEGYKLMDYGIAKDSTICLSSRLRGGCPGSSAKGPVSFKDAVKGKMDSQKKPEQQDTAPGAYIVEQTTQNPALVISIPEVNEIQSDYLTKAVICRFNGFWPKPEALRQWIYSIWTENCDIHLCSKGFFIVKFDTIKDKDYALNEGPWFWGNAGLFVRSWFPDFDPNSMVVTKMPVWVKLFNLPIHFWHYKVLEGIGNTLGSFLKADHERLSKDIYTFARICVEVDLSQGLPEHIILIHDGKQWAQPLDYENTAFRCRICRQTGHLQSTCPQNKKDRKRRQPPKPKGWQFSATWTEDAEEEKEEGRNEGTNSNIQEDEDSKINTVNSNANYPHHLLSNENLIEGAIDTNAVNPQQQDENTRQEIGGSKRAYSPTSTDSEKDIMAATNETQMIIVTDPPNNEGWRKVEKKKGRKV